MWICAARGEHTKPGAKAGPEENTKRQSSTEHSQRAKTDTSVAKSKCTEPRIVVCS